MRALTLWQPWASLVAIGAKQWETRSWGTKYRGPLLIHAAMRKPPEITKPLVVEEMIQALGMADFSTLPRGVVLAVVGLGGVYRLSAEDPVYPPICSGCAQREALIGDWSDDRYVWELQGGYRLRVPVSAVGRRGLWCPSADTVRKIKSQISINPQQRPAARCVR